MAGRLKAAGLLAAMFALGLISGVAWQSHQVDQQHLHRFYETRRIQWLQHQLHLTSIQALELKEIIQAARERAQDIDAEVSPDMSQIHDDSIEAIRALLTPEQQKRFDHLHEKSLASQQHSRKKIHSAAADSESPLEDVSTS